MKKQNLLYLTAATTSPAAVVTSMNLVEDGKLKDVPENPDDWAYQSVLDAINDGWRVIKFPEQALLLSEERNYGLGCEYVLEKIEG